jgi:membrane-associated PAP2 superfamily phosphatase
VLALGLSTAFVTPLKQLTQVQCPWSLSQFGGSETYSKLPRATPGYRQGRPVLAGWPCGDRVLPVRAVLRAA